MEIIGAVLELVLMGLAVVTALALCWRCIYGFESAQTRANLQEIARAMREMSPRKVAE